MFKCNRIFVYFLIVTIVGSLFAYIIVVKGYDNAYADYNTM